MEDDSSWISGGQDQDLPSGAGAADGQGGGERDPELRGLAPLVPVSLGPPQGKNEKKKNLKDFFGKIQLNRPIIYD